MLDFKNKKQEFIYYVNRAEKFKNIDKQEFISCMLKAKEIKEEIASNEVESKKK